jgi:hypothetical protein
MTSSLLAPGRWRRSSAGRAQRTVLGSSDATAILDSSSAAIASLVAEHEEAGSGRELVQALHGEIARRVRAVHSVEERQAASVTLDRGQIGRAHV